MPEPVPDSQSCPRCQHGFQNPLNFCPRCGADLRGMGGFTDTFSGPLVDKVIADRYKLIDRLGEGGMGAVYKVQHTRMGKVMALKLLRPELSKQRSAVERFEQEAQLVARLSSLHTISIFDFGETAEGELYLTMEYLPGHDLASLLHKDGPFPEARTADIGIQVLRSLAEAHEAGIIHRDIKPANVMLLRTRERQDLVKVLDFGIAKLRVRKGSGAITGLGDFVGTPEYLSPEQARGEELTPASDIYSLGAMLYELACGVPVFDGPTPLSIISRHLTERPVPPHERTPQVRCSPEFEGVLLRALEKDPGHRFATADEMREALEPLAGPRAAPALAATPMRTGDLNIASRDDWDRFERKLRRGLWLRNASALAVTAAILAAGTVLAKRALDAPLPALPEEREPNDRPAQANLLASGRAIRGHLGARFSESESDKDFFRLPVQGPDQILRVEVTGLRQIALVVDLYGPEQKSPLARADFGKPGAQVVIPDWPVSTGSYFIEVRAKVPPGQLPPENVSDWYTLTATTRARLLGEEREPNDTPETASPATLAQPGFGYAGELGEVDDWSLDPLSTDSAVEGVRVGAAVSPVAGAELRLSRPGGAGAGGRAIWVTDRPDRLKLVVELRVVRGRNEGDLYALAFFTQLADGGGAVLNAARRLVALGRPGDAAALVESAVRLAPAAPWAQEARKAAGLP